MTLFSVNVCSCLSSDVNGSDYEGCSIYLTVGPFMLELSMSLSESFIKRLGAYDSRTPS